MRLECGGLGHIEKRYPTLRVENAGQFWFFSSHFSSKCQRMMIKGVSELRGRLPSRQRLLASEGMAARGAGKVLFWPLVKS